MGNHVALPAPGDRVAERYSVVRVIGEGGMGVVYEAVDARLGQRVAMKVLRPSLAGRKDIVARFEREVGAAAKLTSGYVARVLDFGTLDGKVPFMVMEYLDGNDLAGELVARGPLPIGEAVGYVLQACEAMAEAHRLGIVHRDLKPANLFLTRSAGTCTVKVLDFGISKLPVDPSEASMTSTFSALGTALYMSPEQVRSAKHVDTRTDVWALGVVLYELLAGRRPFEGETATSVAAAVVADTPEPLRSVRGDVPEALERAVITALVKDRTQRFQTVTALAEAIAPFAPRSEPLALETGTLIDAPPSPASAIPTAVVAPPSAGSATLPFAAMPLSAAAGSSPGMVASAAVPSGSVGAPHSAATVPGWAPADPGAARGDGRSRWLVPALAACVGIGAIFAALTLQVGAATGSGAAAALSAGPDTAAVLAPSSQSPTALLPAGSAATEGAASASSAPSGEAPPSGNIAPAASASSASASSVPQVAPQPQRPGTSPPSASRPPSASSRPGRPASAAGTSKKKRGGMWGYD